MAVLLQTNGNDKIMTGFETCDVVKQQPVQTKVALGELSFPQPGNQTIRQWRYENQLPQRCQLVVDQSAGTLKYSNCTDGMQMQCTRTRVIGAMFKEVQADARCPGLTGARLTHCYYTVARAIWIGWNSDIGNVFKRPTIKDCIKVNNGFLGCLKWFWKFYLKPWILAGGHWDDNNPDGGLCVADQEREGGRICLSNRCRQEIRGGRGGTCGSDGECDRGFACDFGICTPGEGAIHGNTGGICQDAHDCGAGFNCVSGTCGRGCQDTNDCGAGSNCTNGTCIKL